MLQLGEFFGHSVFINRYWYTAHSIAVFFKKRSTPCELVAQLRSVRIKYISLNVLFFVFYLGMPFLHYLPGGLEFAYLQFCKLVQIIILIISIVKINTTIKKSKNLYPKKGIMMLHVIMIMINLAVSLLYFVTFLNFNKQKDTQDETRAYDWFLISIVLFELYSLLFACFFFYMFFKFGKPQKPAKVFDRMHN